MPKVRGITIVKKARAIRPDINVLPVTGLEGTVSKEEARDAGVKEVLAEPLSAAELEAAIRCVLG
jgi:DNA-binding response OmpR family regulator